MKIVELCQENSVGNRYYAPRVVSASMVADTEAATLIALKLSNGFYWREQPEDTTGAELGIPFSAKGLAARLKLLREARSLSQEQLAQESGVHRTSIARIEGGVIDGEKIPVSTARKLARALGVTLEQLAGDQPCAAE